LIRQSKTGISSFELSRHLGVNYDKAWLLHNKILWAMSDRDDASVLRGKIQIDDAYFGGEQPVGKAVRGSEIIFIVVAFSVNEAGHPVHAKIIPVAGFSSEAIATWARDHLNPGSADLSDELASFRSIAQQVAVTRSSSTVASTPTIFHSFAGVRCWATSRSSLNGTFHAFIFDKYARNYLGGHCFRSNRRFSLPEMTERIANVVCCYTPCTERQFRVAEAFW